MHTTIRPPRQRSARVRAELLPRRAPRDRDGRLLVECMLVALLLNATALVLVSAALGLVGAAQHADNSSQSWAISLQQLETAAATRCPPSLSSGAIAVGVRRVSWGEQVVGADSGARDRTLTITQPASPWARHRGLAAADLQVRDARGCE